MFKRANLLAKYKLYAKTLKVLQDKAKSECAAGLAKQYESIRESVKSIVQHNEYINAQCKAFCIGQSKISERIEQANAKCMNFSLKRYSLRQKLPHGKFLISTALAAIPFIQSDPVTSSGYSQDDYNLLKQLGIIVEDMNVQMSSTNESTVNVATEGVPLQTSTSESNSPLPTDLPPSLYDSSNNYTSIFDSMPEERNDLYTLLTNTFSSTSEKSTQVHKSDLEAFVESPTASANTFTNDFFVIETPGNAAVDKAAENAFVTSVVGDGEGEMLGGDVLTAVNVDNASNNFSDANSKAEEITTHVTYSTDDVVIEPIPEPPSLPDLAAEAASKINALGEETFASLGLGGWTPVGIVQNCFEYLHVSLGIPWWEAIAIGTLVIRFAMFPLVVMSQRNAAKMNNHLPQMQVIQLKMTEARQSGNQMDVARYTQELMLFMQEKKLNPLKNMIVPMAQMPIFVSLFMGLRQMANVPVDSMRTGGIFWFTDLTVPDQFFALPIITSLTLWATIELGTDSARLNSANLQTMKYVLRAMPFVILPFTVNFPGAILCYWTASNFISLGQVGFLKIPAVRDYFKIDPLLHHDASTLPIPNKGFVGGIKDSWTNLKITKEIEERRRLDELQFQRAGKGPLVKTYKYDPTQQVKRATSAKSALKSSA